MASRSLDKYEFIVCRMIKVLGLGKLDKIEKCGRRAGIYIYIHTHILDLLLTIRRKCVNYFQVVANFMGKARGGRVTFDPSCIVMSGGATGANKTVMFCLANPGDAFLVPSPCYPA